METKEAYHAIAATIAAHTPIGTRYQLVAIPGTELADACTNCGGAHHVQQCGELRAALGRVDADSTIAWLREELAEAHNHIGALVAAVSERGENFDLNDVVAEAKAWLRREAK